MFGTKLRTWMEAHIVRSRKKKDRKKGDKGFDSNCNSPRNYVANRSPGLHQVHPVDSPTKNVDGIRLHEGSSRSGTVTTSSATSAGTASVNLSSPESAYSTGYSTDGTSPGTSYPPEYYINIRTGTHYFHSNTANGRPKRPLDATDQPSATLLPRHGTFENNVEPSYFANMTGRDTRHPRDLLTSTPNESGERLGKHRPTKQQQQQVAESQSQAQQERYHRRTESFSADTSRNKQTVPSSIPPPLLSPSVQSPRERSRIRTNPWLSANSSGSSSTGFKSRSNLDDTSSGSGLKLTESSGSASDVNVNSAREGLAGNDFKQESLSAGRSPINHNWRIASGLEIRPKIALSVQRRSSSSSHSSSSSSSNGNSESSGSSVSNNNHSGSSNGNANGNGSSGSSLTRSVRSSEDDITLNEMMGKFDESYVYEKETDILSDSDPTDCEDYIESLSDADAARDAGDENDPTEKNDFDYIDNGSSFLDLDNLDCSPRFPNTGHCTYFPFAGEPARRSSKLRESLVRRRNRDDATTMFQRSISARNGAKRQTARQKKSDEKQQSEKRKKRISQRRKSNLEKRDGSRTGDGELGPADYDDEEETANLNRVLVERMLMKNSGFNQGSRSVGGTPICLRRRKHDVNKNLSPMRLANEQRALARITDFDSEEIVKRRSNSVSYVNGNIVRRRISGNAYMTTFASEIALIEADKEADKKYRELILEAENILVNMQKNQHSVPIAPSPSRKFHNGLANKRVELIKNTELNIEFALSRSRNSQPELQSGSIKDLEHTSPKRQFLPSSSPMRRLAERNASPVAGFYLNDNPYVRQETPVPIKCLPDSPLPSRRTSPGLSPTNSLLRYPRSKNVCQQDSEERNVGRSATPLNCNGILRPDLESPFGRSQACFQNRGRANLAHRESPDSIRDCRVSRLSAREEGVTSSSSDSEEKCDVRRRAPLMTFRSVDMGPIKEASSYCPQSEPVKRKVYAGSTTYDRIQKTLGEQLALRNSDGDTATDDTDDSRKSLREKVARLRQERLTANANVQDSQILQHQLSQLRRQMLMQTIEGLKRSLEDQSATLKQTCLEPVMTNRLP